jgi:predicted MFS family arabinose efflux permease
MVRSSKHFTHLSFYPWLVIALCASFLFFKYVLQISPSIMTADLMREFNITGAGLGNLAATYFYAYLFMQLFVGYLLDRYSPRYLSAFAILTCAIGAFIFSHANSLAVAAISRALIGVGVAFATVSYMKITALWFKPQQFAFVGGLLATAAMLGGVFGQAPLSLLVSYAGWRTTMMIVSIVGLIIAVLFFSLVRDQRQDGSQPFLHIEKQGFTLQDLGSLLKSKQNWVLTLYSGLAFTPVAVFGGLWGNPFFESSYQLSQTQAASLVSCMFIGMAIGSPLIGLLSDRIRKRVLVMKWGALLSLIILALVIYLPLPIWLISCLMFCFGFSTGAYMLCFALGREMNKISLAATVIALINTGDAIFGSITEPAIGKLLDMRWDGTLVNGVRFFSEQDFHFALIPLVAYLLGAFLLLWGLREPSLS